MQYHHGNHHWGSFHNAELNYYNVYRPSQQIASFNQSSGKVFNVEFYNQGSTYPQPNSQYLFQPIYCHDLPLSQQHPPPTWLPFRQDRQPSVSSQSSSYTDTFDLSRQSSTSTLFSDYFSVDPRKIQQSIPSSLSGYQYDLPQSESNVQSKNSRLNCQWVFQDNLMSDHINEDQREIQPTPRKFKLPSITDIRTFNFKPQPSNEDIRLRRANLYSKKRRNSINETMKNLHLFRVSKKLTETPIPKPITSQAIIMEDLSSPPSIVTGIAPKKAKSKISNLTKYTDERVIPKDSSTEEIITASFFPEYQITEEFLARNILRDPELRQKIDPTNFEQEIEFSEDSILKFKVYEFLFTYLDLNDIRDEYASKDKNEWLKEIDLYDLRNEFDIDIKFELEKKDEDGFKKQPRKNVDIHMKVSKLSTSLLSKSRILSGLQTQFNEFFLGNSTHKELNGDTRTGKRKRRSRVVYGKPRWGVGYEDELSILDLKITIN